ncbi:hypothetical protein PM082_012429 [Marasmius tenuissimus]|nr:hypothetical protein PM082_012429 [Marasmius tenuissimus]
MNAANNANKLPNFPPIVDISHPCSKITVALTILENLGMRMKDGDRSAISETIGQMKSRASSKLSRWIKLFLQKIILAVDGPLTPQGVDVLERALTILPSILTFPKEFEEDLAKIANSSSFLLPLFTASWCKVVLENHHSWRAWTHLMRQFSHGPACKGCPIVDIVFSPHTTGDEKQDDQIALKLLRHIDC